MFGIIFTVIISIGLPLLLFFYAYRQKKVMPFLLGSAAFLLSQILLRIPLLQYLGENYPAYTMMSMTNPILFAIMIGLSAGLFEELARFILMTFLVKQRNFQAGFYFGAGHGGIEAVLIVGIPVATLLFSPTMALSSEMAFMGGIERFFAIVLHIGLSILILQAIVQKISICPIRYFNSYIGRCTCRHYPVICKARDCVICSGRCISVHRLNGIII